MWAKYVYISYMAYLPLKIAGALILVILLCMTYAFVSPGAANVSYKGYSLAEEFVEGNSCNDFKALAVSKLNGILDSPIANANGKPRVSAQDMMNQMQKIEADAENGMGDFKGNTQKCFPERAKINLDMGGSGPEVQVQKVRNSLIPDPPPNADSGK
jgi:hypothetical protein